MLLRGKFTYVNFNRLNTRDVNDLYDAFNVGIGGRKDAPAKKMFFDHMKEAGYDAIRDRNDTKYSGYNAKSAIIAFKDNYTFSETKLSDPELQKSANEAMNIVKRDLLLKAVPSYTAAAAGIAAINMSSRSSRARSMARAGVPQDQIAKQLKISQSEVSKLINTK